MTQAATSYITTEDLRGPYLGLDGSTFDEWIDRAIDAASRQIDNYCNRFFFPGSSGEVRTFTADDAAILTIDDATTITAIATDLNGDGTFETTWSANDWRLLPANAAVKAWPFTHVRTALGGSFGFPRTPNAVRVTGTWGWPAVPAAVVQATAIQAMRLFKRKDIPWGLAGGQQLGTVNVAKDVTGLDGDARDLCDPYVRYRLGALESVPSLDGGW